MHLHGGPGRVEAPELLVDANARVHAFWYHASDPSAPTNLNELVHRVRENGRWYAPAVLHRARPEQDLPPLIGALRIDRDVHLLHTTGSGSVLHRVLSDRGWTGRGEIPVLDGPAPSLVAGPGGSIAMAEIAALNNPLLARGSFGNVMVRTYTAGQWSLAIPVDPRPDEHSHAPQLAYDRRGVLHVVWLQGEGGELLPTRLLHAWSKNGRTWSEPVDLAIGVPGKSLYSPRLALDAGGRVHLTFTRFREELTGPRHYHAYLEGTRWSRPAEMFPGAGTPDSELETAVDSQGRLHALWKDGSGYTHSWLEQAQP